MIKKAMLIVPGKKGACHSLEVQYNPATLNVEARSRPVVYENPQTCEIQDDVTQNIDNGELTLSFDLDIDSQGGQDVRRTIQGLLGMLFRESTRKIAFCWGDMDFEGEVEKMSASFDLFDSDGDPLHGKVHIEIVRRDFTGVI